MIRASDIKLSVIRPKPRQQDVDNQGFFIKVEHIESKITVTKFSRTSIKGKGEAVEELEILVKAWLR